MVRGRRPARRPPPRARRRRRPCPSPSGRGIPLTTRVSSPRGSASRAGPRPAVPTSTSSWQLGQLAARGHARVRGAQLRQLPQQARRPGAAPRTAPAAGPGRGSRGQQALERRSPRGCRARGQEPAEHEAGRLARPATARAAVTADGPGTTTTSCAGRAGGGHQPRAGVADGRHARVGRQRQRGTARQPRQQLRQPRARRCAR